MRILVVIAALLSTPPLSAGLADLARSGDWEKVVEVASRRADQLPLSAGEAMIAAYAARALGDLEAEELFLAGVGAGGGSDLDQLADVLTATLIQTADPERAVELALPAFGRDTSWPVREAAAEATIAALAAGITPERRISVEAAARKLPRSLRRRLELELALSDEEQGRQALDQLLAASTRDLAALQAAETLSAFESLTPSERWRIAMTLYRHALYDRAAPIFEELDSIRDKSIPSDEVAFLRGRCAFRGEQWSEAIAWYQKALSRSRTAERRAVMEVHVARCYELSGEMDAAVEAAQRAVRSKTTDERRLFLARLRLRRDEPDLAAQGISRLKSRKYRAQGEVMLAVDALRRGDRASALRRLERVQQRPWAGPAAVLAAELSFRNGDAGDTLAHLERAAGALDEFWGIVARDLMVKLGQHEVDDWRRRSMLEVDSAEGRSRWLALGRWAGLETDQQVLAGIRQRVEAELGWPQRTGILEFEPGLAAELWNIGLGSEAARWDPSGFPRSDTVASTWSAARFLEYGFPRRATRVADGAWRQAGSEVPSRAMPPDIRQALYPFPEPDLVRSSAASGKIDWSLLAAVAREESRWDARALSAVGARGLVQLMPATAIAVAARVGTPEPTRDDLFDPRISLELGAVELGRLVEVFGGQRAPAVAAYNAGEAQAKLWLEQCGEGCNDALYLMNISFASTRGYTANVLSAATVYAEMYPADVEISDRISSLPGALRLVRANSRSLR
jgi:soluble lytic murein transglycosylase-like protein/tetratricopeptide (TPR) repeat protein